MSFPALPRPLSRPLVLLSLCTSLLALPLAAGANNKSRAPEPATIELSAEARGQAENDLGQAQLYFEASDADAAKLAAQVNRVIAEALETAGKVSSVTATTAGTTTHPIRSKDGNKIESWRMRSSISLESRDIPALSSLIGQLQQSLMLSGVSMRPAAETRSQAADLAAVDAIRAFEERAGVLAETLGKSYRIRHLSVQHGGGMPVYPMMMRAASVAADEAAPAPMQGGHSDITVTIHGTIELID